MRRQGENGCSTSFSSVLYHGVAVLSIPFCKIFFIFLSRGLWQKCTKKPRPSPARQHPTKQVKSYKELPLFVWVVRHDVARRNVAVKVRKICQKDAGNFEGLLFFTKIDANFRYFCPLYKRAELRYNSRAAKRVSPRPQLAVKPARRLRPPRDIKLMILLCAERTQPCSFFYSATHKKRFLHPQFIYKL